MERGYDSLSKWVSIMHRQFQMFMNKQLKAYGLNSSEFLYIITLSYKSGMSQDELARELHLDNAAVTRSIKSLEKKEFVYRERDKENHRMKRVYLTKKGEAFLPQLRSILDSWDNYAKSTIEKDKYTVVTSGLREMSHEMLNQGK